jgi:hypothetical protein
MRAVIGMRQGTGTPRPNPFEKSSESVSTAKHLEIYRSVDNLLDSAEQDLSSALSASNQLQQGLQGTVEKPAEVRPMSGE